MRNNQRVGLSLIYMQDSFFKHQESVQRLHGLLGVCADQCRQWQGHDSRRMGATFVGMFFMLNIGGAVDFIEKKQGTSQQHLQGQVGEFTGEFMCKICGICAPFFF